MNKPVAVCAALVCCRLAFADQITMKNGDRVTGSIVKKVGNDLTIKTDRFGVVTTQWDQVESVKTDKPVTVALPDGKSVQGAISTAGGRVEVAGQAVPPAEVVTIRDAAEQSAYERLQRPRFDELWAGTASVGLAGSTGNAKTLTFTTGVNASRVTNTDKTSIYFSVIKATAVVNAVSAETARAVRGGLGYDHNINPRLFVNLFNDYEYDRFQNLDLRFVIGGGLGFHAWKSESSRLDLVGGGDFNHSSFSTPLTRNAGELYWGDEYALKLTGATSLVQTFRMFHDMNDTGIRRVNFDLGAVTKVSKWLTWNLAFSDRYLSRPAPGKKTNDLLYTTGLGITFGH